MKLGLRKIALAAIVALTASVATVPAHATLSGSEPRPNFAGGQTSYYLYAAMTVLGF